jgi:Tfp pilus assembly PilM family ATPase
MARHFVGLDIGHHTVRAVALRRDGNKFAVAAHAQLPRLDDDGSPRPIRALVQEMGKLVPLGPSPVVAISDLQTLIKYVSTMPLPPDRLQRLLRLELLQTIEAQELAADSFVVPLAGEEVIHCCALTQPTAAGEALRDIIAAGVADPILHVSSIAMYNATLPLPPVNDDELALLVDIGAARTNVAVIGDRRLLACRQLAVGGDTFTEALAGLHQQEKHHAEQRKIAGEGSQGAEAVGRKKVHSAAELSEKNDPFAIFPASATANEAKDADTTHNALEKNSDLTGGLELDDGDNAVAANKPAKKETEKEAENEAKKHNAVEEFVLDDDDHQSEITRADNTNTEPDVAHDPQFSLGAVQSVFSSSSVSAASDKMETVAVPAPGFATVRIASRALGPELAKVAEMLYGQLASSLAWFRTQIQARQLAVKKVYLCGGGAGLDGLQTYLQRRFNLPVEILNPTDNLGGNHPERSYEYTTAIGLALAAAKRVPGTIALDLSPDSLLVKRQWRTTLIWPYVAAACLLIATFLACWTMWNEQAVAQENLDAFAAYRQEFETMEKKLADLQREREGLSEDLRAIAGRIYAGRDMLHTIRALKEQTESSRELWVTSLKTVDIGKDADVSDPSQSTNTRGGIVRLSSPAPAHSSGRRDTAIDRGGIDIAGLVKFDQSQSDTQLNQFFENYKAALDAWKPAADEPKLFRDSRVRVHVISHDDKKSTVKTSSSSRVRTSSRDAETISEKGRFPFEIRFFFQPTQLDRITSAQTTVERKRQP